MVAELAGISRRPLTRAAKGSASPRLGPPVPAADTKEFQRTATELGIKLMPAQITVARYIEAKARNGLHLYPEIAVEWSRQNGKTTIAKPLIVKALRAGLRVLHIADKRELPREMHSLVANALSTQPALFPRRRGKIIWPRYGAGQEEIELLNGGRYRIAAARTGGARGWAADILIVDELREMKDFSIVSASDSTLLTALDPLTLYFTNEGDESSVVLHSIRERAGEDPSLAYLEWSTAPEFEAGDERGWLQSNPAIGHIPSVLPWLRRAYRKHLLAGTMHIFETENLCRSVPMLAPRVVATSAWASAKGTVEPMNAPALAVKLDPSGTRASAALAWQQSDGRIALTVGADVVGEPVHVAAFGRQALELRRQSKARQVGHDAWTDAELAKYLKGTTAINGREFANASANFASLVDGGRLVWADAEAVGEDLAWAGRKTHESGWEAVAASDKHPVTALLAAIRAVSLASGPPRPPLRLR